MKLHIDVETYSSIDIMSSGAYKYCESLDFQLLLLAYAIDDNDVQIIDLAQGELIPDEFFRILNDPTVEKHAHNANFERIVFKTIGHDIPIDQWYCSAVKASYCGLPLSLDFVSKALNLGDKGKLATGKALIRYFCIPIKPTKANNYRHRNFPKHDIYKWDQFKQYCIGDVVAEMQIGKHLDSYVIPEFDRDNYILDQEINDAGILIDLDMARTAYNLDQQHSAILSKKLKNLTGLDNPNSPAQLKKWLGEAMQKEIKSLAKDVIPELIKEAESETVKDVLKLRQRSSKSSIKKYVSMLNCACEDNRAHGLFQFYGANKTGRWAGRLIQLQNLPRNYLKNISSVRKDFNTGDYDFISLSYDNISDTLSQLIRTTFIAPKGKTFAVADFSAIEARVTAYLAGEDWRIEVFKSHGKIYEASASMMFGVPLEEITKGSELRTKGKIAELALGYQGALGALKKMGGEDMGLSENEMQEIVKKWRNKSPNIVRYWKGLETFAKRSIKLKKKQPYRGLEFDYDGNAMTIKLPSGRQLFYQKPRLSVNRFGQESIKFRGIDQLTKQWVLIDTYGGKLCENVVQAVSRDLLAYSMQRLKQEGFKIVMHVHDEVVCEVENDDDAYSTLSSLETLETMCEIMGEEVPWAKGLPLTADGYVTPFYMKD